MREQRDSLEQEVGRGEILEGPCLLRDVADAVGRGEALLERFACSRDLVVVDLDEHVCLVQGGDLLGVEQDLFVTLDIAKDQRRACLGEGLGEDLGIAATPDRNALADTIALGLFCDERMCAFLELVGLDLNLGQTSREADSVVALGAADVDDALELELRDALVNGELELHYQPLVATQTMQTVGYEALLRWNHPTRGPVSPDQFIPIAEETGQIVQIGEWVLREALAEAARWPDHLTVSVNLSPVQTMDKELYGTIVHALAASAVPAHRLELEITETVLMRECDETIALLHKIRALGVRVALDDFGTGYSSLNYLRAFPFDKIKIDRCFVGDMAEREDSDTIVKAVIALATRLNMSTTAEGIENAEQMELLRATECSQMQGYLFSRAVPAAQLVHRVPARKVAAPSVERLGSRSPKSQPGREKEINRRTG